jgi:hypothetical protein
LASAKLTETLAAQGDHALAHRRDWIAPCRHDAL